jgi:ABC-type multidrug transport system fused ATPase/permease subunit
MHPVIQSMDEEHRAPHARLPWRTTGRILALIRPHWREVAVGVLLTLVFAGMHTLSVASLYPVLKVLLEPEGVRGWLDRTVAGERFGAVFAPPSDADATQLLVTRVRGDAPAARAGVQAYDLVSAADGRAVREWIHEAAHAPDGGEVALRVTPSGGADRPARAVAVSAPPAEGTARWLASAARRLPAGSDATAKRRAIGVLLGVMVAVVALGNLFRYLGEVLIVRAVLRAVMGLRARLYERVLELPMSFFAGRSTADLISKFVQDMQEIQRGMVMLFGKFLREPFRAAGVLALALWLNWRITLTIAVLAPIVGGAFWVIGRKVKKSNRRLLEGYGRMIDALTASLQNIRVVKAYTAEEPERERLRRVDVSMFRQQLRLARLEALTSPLMETLGVVAGCGLAVWFASMVLENRLSMSQFGTLSVALAMMFDPLRRASDVFVRVMRSTAGAERIFQVIDTPPEQTRAAGGVELAPLASGIEFDGVTFTYPGADRPALLGVRLTIHKGETLAIVGPNGSGKTTLASMIPRFYDPREGSVRFDGVDIRAVRLMSLRRQIGLVTQDAVIFAGTPIENIAYGNGAVERRRVEEAAARARADEFIRMLPGGYEATLGERGTTLSGGQRQRLAIARAIYRDAPILIFDEATSQVDSESEQKIQAALRELTVGRTTVIIAHRLSTIQFADRIVVMDEGRIVDSGSHADLVGRCPLYRALCETQLVTTP